MNKIFLNTLFKLVLFDFETFFEIFVNLNIKLMKF